MKITPYVTEKSAILEGEGFKTFRVPTSMNKIEFARLVSSKLPKTVNIVGRVSSKVVAPKLRVIGKGKVHTRRKKQKLMTVRLSDPTVEISFN